MQRYVWRLLLEASSLPSLIALLFYTLVPESPRFLYAKEKAEGKGTSGKGARNEREVVTLEEDEIKDVTLDLDKTVAGPKVEQGNPKNKKEDETNEKTKLIIRNNNTHEFLDITEMVKSITQLGQTIAQVLISVWLRLAPLRENLITSMDESILQAIFGILDDGDLRTKNVHAIMLVKICRTKVGRSTCSAYKHLMEIIRVKICRTKVGRCTCSAYKHLKEIIRGEMHTSRTDYENLISGGKRRQLEREYNEHSNCHETHKIMPKGYQSKELNPIIFFIGKLKVLKRKIREWNNSRRSVDISFFSKLKLDLESIDEIIDRGDRNDEIMCDENSSFFHGMLNKKRRTLNVRGVLVDGSWIDNPIDVKDEFFNHFSTRFRNPDPKEAYIEMDFPNVLSQEDRQFIEREVSIDEIKKAVWDCGTDKAPGPDGFTFGFYRRYWDLIHGEVTNAVRYFFTHCDIPHGCNSSFITLIPKNQNAKLGKDFRPISLIGSFYKIIAKILANRLVSVIKGLINEVQSAFIAKRQILDGPFILNEVIQWCKLKKNQILIFKMDFEKAYDSIRSSLALHALLYSTAKFIIAS
uniref:RNA-directed DNA polymerase, eukaryota, reverse transcriptase zinc-binding domain protein n=1 Tax=Tanacetum cinerariifolium TaxID=118510 RepID=A0A6L2JG32_TANCI|nr:RNA-directed DNA polymerase, eukaryota, reverse transcriptase zinc-binding domain protein [Tanacetum cinerariifolium]